MEIFILIFTFMGPLLILSGPFPQTQCLMSSMVVEKTTKTVPCDADLHTLLTEARAVAECPGVSVEVCR